MVNEPSVFESLKFYCSFLHVRFPVSFLHKSIAGHDRPVRVADGPIMVRYRFIMNASWVAVVVYFCLILPEIFG